MELKKFFEQNQNPAKEILKYLGQKLSLTQNQIQSWCNEDQIEDTRKDFKTIFILPKAHKDLLKKTYEENSCPDRVKLQELSSIVCLSEEQIQTWFHIRQNQPRHQEVLKIDNDPYQFPELKAEILKEIENFQV